MGTSRIHVERLSESAEHDGSISLAKLVIQYDLQREIKVLETRKLEAQKL